MDRNGNCTSSSHKTPLFTHERFLHGNSCNQTPAINFGNPYTYLKTQYPFAKKIKCHFSLRHSQTSDYAKAIAKSCAILDVVVLGNEGIYN